MNQVSPCCHKSIVVSHRLEYPLGGRTWHQTFKIDVCEGRGREVEEYLSECEECGTVDCVEHNAAAVVK